MIKFDLDRSKIIKTKIRTQHVTEGNIDFVFRLIIEGVEYGFKGTLTDGHVVFRIPPLREYVEDMVNADNEYPVRIETVANQRFFQRPWTDSAKFTSMPKLELEEVNTDDDLDEEQGVGVSVESVEEKDEDIVKKFKDAEAEVLKEKEQRKSHSEKEKAPSRKSKKFTRHIRGEVLDEHSRLRQLLREVREKNENG